MAGGITIELKGLDAALGKLDVKKFEVELQGELDLFGVNVQRDAQQLAPIDEGHLHNHIFYHRGRLSAEIVATTDYAAYVEFGTRKFAQAHVASLPTEWQQFAAQYRGGGGSFEELVMRITGWVKRKGIDEKAAYPIALKILRDGIPAQPFLYPAFTQNTKKLIDNLKNLTIE